MNKVRLHVYEHRAFPLKLQYNYTLSELALQPGGLILSDNISIPLQLSPTKSHSEYLHSKRRLTYNPNLED